MAKKSIIFKRTLQVFVLLLSALILVIVTQYFDIFAHQVADSFNRGPVLLEEDFEAGTLSKWSQEDLCCEHSLQFVSSPTRAGSQAAKFQWSDDDLPFTKGKARAELKRYGLFGLETERWYGFSIYIPEDYEETITSNVVAQWHELPDFFLGEKFRQPPLVLNTRGADWTIIRRWDPDRVNHRVGPRGGEERISLGNYEVGKWTDWVFHVKWSINDTGIFELWKDGELVLQREGPNTYNDFLAPYFKAGIYQQKDSQNADFLVNSRTLFFDEIRIGNKQATYEDVAPASVETAA